MLLPYMSGLYVVMAVCALSTFLLTRIDPLADWPDHPQYHFKTFLMMMSSVTFIYLFLSLFLLYIGWCISSVF